MVKFDSVIRRFDPSRPSQPLARPKIAVILCAKSLHLQGCCVYRSGLQTPKTDNYGENLPKVSSPNRKNSSL
jgi:hypothetical protein